MQHKVFKNKNNIKVKFKLLKKIRRKFSKNYKKIKYKLIIELIIYTKKL